MKFDMNIADKRNCFLWIGAAESKLKRLSCNSVSGAAHSITDDQGVEYSVSQMTKDSKTQYYRVCNTDLNTQYYR